MVLAVLEARAGLQVGSYDVYLNVAGGLKVKETAADLAVAAAILSSLTGTIVPQGTTLFGEIALSGAIRPVSLAEARVKEAHKLGLSEAVTAARPEILGPKDFRIKTMETISDLVAWAGSQPKGLARIA
jgi:DNA repair protein RadA/Sms